MPDIAPASLVTRRAASARRFENLQQAIERLANQIDENETRPYDLSRICIYATGSYGRGESAESSDIDLFMVDVAEPAARLGNIGQTLLRADLIRACRALEFPEFSGDGRYLVVHPFDNMLDALGGQQDDAANFFTARLLLLLESQCLYNSNVYDRVVVGFIGEYFRDYIDHPESFVPGFLVNDIVRFWKTLCLNYEFDRATNAAELQKDPTLRRAFRLKNLKLSFSRLMTCYSALVLLAAIHQKGATHPNEVRQLVAHSPTERLEALAEMKPDARESASLVLEHYGWFLDVLGSGKDAALEWLADSNHQREAGERAVEYRDAFYALLMAAGPNAPITRFITM